VHLLLMLSLFKFDPFLNLIDSFVFLHMLIFLDNFDS